MIQKTFNHLRQKWNIESTKDLVLIMIVFSLAGINVTLCRKPLFHVLGVTPHTAMWIKTLLYIAFVFPTYQLSLLLYSLPLGQFPFFWNKQRQGVRFLVGKFSKKRTA